MSSLALQVLPLPSDSLTSSTVHRAPSFASPAQVDLICGTTNALLNVAEPEKCTYLFQVSTPAVCIVKDELPVSLFWLLFFDFGQRAHLSPSCLPLADGRGCFDAQGRAVREGGVAVHIEVKEKLSSIQYCSRETVFCSANPFRTA